MRKNRKTHCFHPLSIYYRTSQNTATTSQRIPNLHLKTKKDSTPLYAIGDQNTETSTVGEFHEEGRTEI
jgi:hypothetical protein